MITDISSTYFGNHCILFILRNLLAITSAEKRRKKGKPEPERTENNLRHFGNLERNFAGGQYSLSTSFCVCGIKDLLQLGKAF